MAGNGAMTQYVVLPVRGLRAVTRTSTPQTRSFLQSFPKPGAIGKAAALALAAPVKAKVRLLEAIAEDGAKLVEATPEGLLALREQQPDLRIVPVVHYRRQTLPPESISTKAAATAGPKLKLKLVSDQDGSPVAGAKA